MKRTAILTLLFFVSTSMSAWAMGSKPKMPDRLTAIIETNQGNITCVLFGKEAPRTVENFVGLAQGTIEWTDPKTIEKVKKPLYDGVVFHRVIPGFMVQGGDPLGSGIGGPGYQFEDEFVPSLVFDQPGILAMANSGPNTNGSQFFITLAPTPWLNGHHTIFGQVTGGQDVVEKIALVKRDGRDKPIEPVIIQKITIKE